MLIPFLSFHSPYHLLFRAIQNYSKLKSFSCQCFPSLWPYGSHKLEQRSNPCVFLGYSLSQSAYLCLDPSSNCLYVSRHVRIDEQTFPFNSVTTSIRCCSNNHRLGPYSFCDSDIVATTHCSSVDHTPSPPISPSQPQTNAGSSPPHAATTPPTPPSSSATINAPLPTNLTSHSPSSSSTSPSLPLHPNDGASSSQAQAHQSSPSPNIQPTHLLHPHHDNNPLHLMMALFVGTRRDLSPQDTLNSRAWTIVKPLAPSSFPP